MLLASRCSGQHRAVRTVQVFGAHHFMLCCAPYLPQLGHFRRPCATNDSTAAIVMQYAASKGKTLRLYAVNSPMER